MSDTGRTAEGHAKRTKAAGPMRTMRVTRTGEVTANMRRVVLSFDDGEGLSYEEAAEICGCAVGTVKSRVSRARTRLSELLGVTDSSEYGPDGVASHVMNRPLVGNSAA